MEFVPHWGMSARAHALVPQWVLPHWGLVWHNLKTPRLRTMFNGAIWTPPSISGRLASCWRVPSQMNCVISPFNLRRYDDIHWSIFLMHSKSWVEDKCIPRRTADIELSVICIWTYVESSSVSNTEDICCVKNEQQWPQSWSLGYRTRKPSFHRYHFTKHHGLSPVAEKKPYPFQGSASNTVWSLKTTDQYVMIHRVKRGAQIQQANESTPCRRRQRPAHPRLPSGEQTRSNAPDDMLIEASATAHILWDDR